MDRQSKRVGPTTATAAWHPERVGPRAGHDGLAVKLRKRRE